MWTITNVDLFLKIWFNQCKLEIRKLLGGENSQECQKRLLSVLVGWYGTSWGFSKTQKEERRRGHNGFCWSQCAVIEGTMGKSRLIGSSSTPVSPVSSPVSPPVSPVSPVPPLSPFHSNILTIRVWSTSIMSNFYWNHSWRSLGSASDCYLDLSNSIKTKQILRRQCCLVTWLSSQFNLIY